MHRAKKKYLIQPAKALWRLQVVIYTLKSWISVTDNVAEKTARGITNMKAWSHKRLVAVVQSFSHVRLFATPWAAARQASYPSPSPRACSNLCPLSWSCHPNISSSCHPLLLLPSFFPSIRVFSSESVLLIRWPKCASASVLPMNIQDWFPLGWTGWISLLSRGLSRVFSNTSVQKHQFFGTQLSL